MGYNTDWNGELKTNREFTKKELKEWNDIIDNRHDSEYEYGDKRREFPSIWCGFEIVNKHGHDGVYDSKGKHGVFRWMGHEKTYQGKEWTIFFLKKLINWSKTKDIYAEGELEWRGDDGDEDMGRVVVEYLPFDVGYQMHIEDVVFDYERDKTYYI